MAGRRGSTSIQKQLRLLCIRSSSGSSTSGEPAINPQRPRDSLFTTQTAVGRVVEQHSKASTRWAPRLTAVMPSKTGRPRTKLGTVCHVSRWAWTQSWTGDHRSWDTTTRVAQIRGVRLAGLARRADGVSSHRQKRQSIQQTPQLIQEP